jgi:hypothetical protein
MTKKEDYRKELKKLNHWDSYLRKMSGLPGPRGNLELAQAVAEEGDQELFERYLRYTPDIAPENTPDVFLAFCGVVGLGRLIAEGKKHYFNNLRELSADSRWRIREGVAIALQQVGDGNMDLLLRELKVWSRGNLLEKRAVAAALCEPRLLKNTEHAQMVLDILNEITHSIFIVEQRKSEEFIVLRKGLGYCWSVAVAAYPEYGKKLMEQWIKSTDKDIRWIMRENLKKNRLLKCDEKWVNRMVKLVE